MANRYKVIFTKAECEELTAITRKGKSNAAKIIHARALLLCDAAEHGQAWKIHYTPKHGSWLNMAEIELSALNGQCLDWRIASIEEMRCEVAAWQKHRNNRGAPINWRFTTAYARIKLTHIYTKL
jgi:hypothetical protein